MTGSPLLLLMTGDPMPAFDLNFMGGMPAGLTYTNSSTTRTYFGSDGLLKTAVANEPIFEYNPVTLALLGMRWEMEQRTNIALYSTLPGGGAAPTGWTQPVGTGTSTPVASIYGNADGAVAYLHSATAQRPFFNQSISVSANTTSVLTILIESKSGTLTASDVILANVPPAGTTVSYPVCSANPSGGASGALGTGELRIQIAVAGTAGTVGARIGLGCNGSITGTLQFSRPQFEAGSSRSSFIPTAGSAVIRQPDVLTATSISPWYRQDEGTVVFEGIATSAGDVERGEFVFHDGTNNNRIFSAINTALATRFYVGNGGVPQASLNSVANTIVRDAVFRNAVAYKQDDFASAINGSAPVTDVSGLVASGITTLRFGGGAVSGSPFMGYARRFQYYNRRLTNSEIQGLSRV